jgi:hypothetical protein
MTRSVLVWVLLLALPVGCSLAKAPASRDYAAKAPEPGAALASSIGGEKLAEGSRGLILAGKNTGAPAGDRQQLIKKGSLTLIVGEARQAETRLNAILKRYDAYIAGRQSSASVPEKRYLAPSEIRSITLTIKVAANRFDELLAQVKQIGSYTHESVQTEDVTFAHADLTARLANQKRVEERLLGHLADKSKDFRSVLEIEKELSRVREQIEQLTAQVRTMENQIAYSTLTLEISVQPEYVPPEKRTFGQEVRETFGGSLRAMGTAARTLAIAAVAVVPWLLVGLALLYGFFRLITWIGGRRGGAKRG